MISLLTIYVPNLLRTSYHIKLSLNISKLDQIHTNRTYNYIYYLFALLLPGIKSNADIPSSKAYWFSNL